MNETVTKEQIEVAVEEAPAPQLPAIRQERKPRERPLRSWRCIRRTSPRPSSPSPARSARSRRKAPTTFRIQVCPMGGHQRKAVAAAREARPDHHAVEQDRSLLEENYKGSVLAIIYHFTIINADGEQWPAVEWTGIARLRDAKGVTDDKAAIKCHTQAEKFFCVKQFKIVTDDFDREDRSGLPKKDARDIYTKLQAEIDAHTSLVELACGAVRTATASRRCHPTGATFCAIGTRR